MQVRKSIGPFAAPKAVFIVEDLPKTRSGKIMRRILRKILSGEEDSLGDTSTVRTASSQDIVLNQSFPNHANDLQLSDPSVVDKIIETVHAARK
jgi:acetyl-CoA synthetase